MVTDIELKSILKKNVLEDTEIISVLEKFIYDQKQVIVKINRPQGRIVISGFNHAVDFQLMDQMYNHALKYYSDKFNNNFD